MIDARKCVGQTLDIFRNRWPESFIIMLNVYDSAKVYDKDNAREFDRGEQCMQTHLYKHFTIPRHSGFLHDVSITLIDKTDPSYPTNYKDYLIVTLKTKAPMGLNFDFDDSF